MRRVRRLIVAGWRVSRRARPSEDGFTLIELMVVVLVIAALIAMSIPSYLGTRQRTNERAAQSNVRNAFEAERLVFASTGEVSSDVGATLPDTEPAFHWLADAIPTNAAPQTVVVSVGTTALTNDTVVLGVKANNGVCFYMRNYVGAGIQFAKDSTCASATSALVTGAVPPPGGWQTTW